MSRTATSTPDAPALTGPVAAPRVVRQRRVRAGHLGLAILMVALGGLLTGTAFLATTRAVDYLAVNRPVAAGTQITRADLATVQVNPAPGLQPIPASRQDTVIGKRAAVSLVPGTLLTAAQLTDTPLVGPGQRQIGVGLKAARLPARKLTPGNEVLLVVTPDDGGTRDAQDSVNTPPETFDAVVVDTGPPGTDGAVVVYVAVPDRQAPRISTLAADGRITMVLKGIR